MPVTDSNPVAPVGMVWVVMFRFTLLLNSKANHAMSMPVRLRMPSSVTVKPSDPAPVSNDVKFSR